MHDSDVTIVVVPRERFSFTRQSLESVYETAGFAEVIYVDGASPPSSRRYLETQATRRGFTYVRTKRYVSPNTARNIGLRHVRTPYVAFVDNDVILAPSWLEHLVECARETGASIVGPLYHIDIAGKISVHMAGGDAHVVAEHGKRVCLESHRHGGASLSSAPAFERTECELVEFHTMLVRMDLFAQTGPLDEGLLSVNEHVDICMLARELGRKVYFEPKSIVTYVPATQLRVSDLPFFMLRWSERWNRATSNHFNAKWRLDRSHPRNRWIVKYGRHHRCRGLRLIGDRAISTRLSWIWQRAVVLAERCFNLVYAALA